MWTGTAVVVALRSDLLQFASCECSENQPGASATVVVSTTRLIEQHAEL